jgi:putative phage-type endonuclease
VEGFKASVKERGLIYRKFIGDGDSSVYAKLSNEKPYGDNILVEKIECRNHLLRNLRSKLNDIINNKIKNTNGLNFNIVFRKFFGANIARILIDTRSAIRYRKLEIGTFSAKAENLKNDLINILHHICGDHSNCANYFCDGIKNEKPKCDCVCKCLSICTCKKSCKCANICSCISFCNCQNNCVCKTCKCVNFCKCRCYNRCTEKNLVPAMIKDGIFFEVKKYFIVLAEFSGSLIYDVDSNNVEQLHSTIAKHIGGKRVNYCLGVSYTMRCYAAVVQHNTKKSISFLWQVIFNFYSNSTLIAEMYEMKQKLSKKTVKKRFPIKYSGEDQYYGPDCEKPGGPDMNENEYEERKKNHTQTLLENQKNRNSILLLTVEQDIVWKKYRSYMMTSSNFGKICKARSDHAHSNIVKNMLHSQEKISKLPAIMYGKDHEDEARRQLGLQENISIEKCGLFIDEKIEYLGASPDGIVLEQDAIVEIKCPKSCAEMNVDVAISEGICKIWKVDKNNRVTFNKNHDYYYQVQGQLQVSNKSKCYFAVWSSPNEALKVEVIIRDQKFWKEKMLEKLEIFYNRHFLPELIDSRFKRRMNLRYFIQAQPKTKA